MPQKYFEKFPIVTYANAQVVDITERVIIANNTLNNPAAFSVYDISSEIRPDQLSNKTYGDPFYAWLIYMGNNITDPYYEWYLTQDQFNEFIVDKYGSFDLANVKIKYFINNWINQNPISINDYDALPDVLQAYWEPQLSPINNSIMNYVRKQEDIIINTNFVIGYDIENTSNTSFINDEIVNVVFSDAYTGKGQVVFSNSSFLFIQHVFGNVLEGSPEGAVNIAAGANVHILNNSYIYGTESTANVPFFTATSYANNISPLEYVYYTPVTYYDYELEKNEGNKSIELIQNTYAYTIATKLKDALK